MSTLPLAPRRVWLRSFYGFMPEEDGYIGWSEESARARMLSLIETGDLFMIYGAASANTEKSQRNRVLGFLQVEARPIRDVDKASALGMKRKHDAGWSDKWTHAVPVTRAWRVDETILLERIATETYRPEAGQAIAVWSPPLLDEEVQRALKIKVKEVNVFGEPLITAEQQQRTQLGEAFSPSRAFPGSSGERTSNYTDGETWLYLSQFEGDGAALLGRAQSRTDKAVLMKIGVTNEPKRRRTELNVGFPPAAIGKWGAPLLSEPYPDRASAEAAEQRFKDLAEKEMESLGGEFFKGDWTTAMVLFARIPGASRFGGQ